MSVFITLVFSLLAIGMLILIYSARTKRKKVEVPALFFWKGAELLHRQQPLFNKFTREKLFYLQFIILSLLLLAIMHFSAGKFFKTGSDQRAILIMDISASMKTMEGRSSRFDLAKEKALTLIKNNPSSDVMIMAAGKTVRTALNFSRDSAEIHETINNLQVENSEADIREALLRTKPYFRSGDSLYLFSDGAFQGLSSIIDETPGLSYIPVGRTGENAGIHDLNVYDQEGTGFKTAGVLLKNFGDNPVRSTVDLLVNGKVVDVQRTDIPAGKEQHIVFNNLPASYGSIKVILNHQDSFLIDNSRHFTQSPTRSIPILLVTEDNSFLRLLFEQLDDYQLTVMSPDSYEKEFHSMGKIGYEIGIYDNYVPAAGMSRASVYINPDENIGGISMSDKYITPTDLHEFREHPVMLYTDFSDVTIQRARMIESFNGTTLLEANHNPLILIIDQDRKLRVVFAFDIKESNFPKNIHFPVFFSNLLSWITSDQNVPTKDTINSGEQFVRLLPEKFRAYKQATIQSPVGTEWIADIREGILSFSDTDQTGIYRVIFENGKMEFAVNLKASEADITPSLHMPSRAESEKTEGPSFLSSAGLWKIFGILAIFCIIYEEKLRRGHGINKV